MRLYQQCTGGAEVATHPALVSKEKTGRRGPWYRTLLWGPVALSYAPVPLNGGGSSLHFMIALIMFIIKF